MKLWGFFALIGMKILLVSCSTSEDVILKEKTVEMTGRKSNLSIYRVKAPVEWRKTIPLGLEEDTKIALCEFKIVDPLEKEIRITIHNFPAESMLERISPMAQVNRWERQFSAESLEEITIRPQSFQGYTGLYFEATGTQSETPITVFGWALQIGHPHINQLVYKQKIGTKEEKALFKEMAADVTIKAIGPPDLMELHKDAIIQFARSFELIDEIPE